MTGVNPADRRRFECKWMVDMNCIRLTSAEHLWHGLCRDWSDSPNGRIQGFAVKPQTSTSCHRMDRHDISTMLCKKLRNCLVRKFLHTLCQNPRYGRVPSERLSVLGVSGAPSLQNRTKRFWRPNAKPCKLIPNRQVLPHRGGQARNGQTAGSCVRIEQRGSRTRNHFLCWSVSTEGVCCATHVASVWMTSDTWLLQRRL